jgi:hypothetical protein
LFEDKNNDQVACQPCKVTEVEGYHKAGEVAVEKLKEVDFEGQTVFECRLVTVVLVTCNGKSNFLVNGSKHYQNGGTYS